MLEESERIFTYIYLVINTPLQNFNGTKLFMQVLTQNYDTCITFFQKSFMSVQIKVYMYVMENGLN